jgi:hypothetical protein
MTKCSFVKINLCFGGMHCLHLQGRWGKQATSSKQQSVAACLFLEFAYLVYSSTLKMEAIRYSETSLKTTWRQIATDNTLLSYCCENLKYKMYLPFTTWTLWYEYVLVTVSFHSLAHRGTLLYLEQRTRSTPRQTRLCLRILKILRNFKHLF